MKSRAGQNPSRPRIAGAIVLAAIGGQIGLQAANLKPATAEAWDEYVQAADARIKSRLTSDTPFLWVDEAPERTAKIRRGEIVVSPAAPHIPRKVPNGLIHDWIGATFIPNANIHDAMTVVRDYEKYKQFYHPNVIESKAVSATDTQDRFSAVLMNKALFEKTALDSEYEATYTRVDEKRLYTISRTTRIREIAGYGTPQQHTLPEDEGTGLIWRLYSVLRFEERDGGLFIEVEALVLSRDIPAAVRLFVEPIVRRVSRDALTTALKQTESALHSVSAAATANRSLSSPTHSLR